VVDDDAVGRLVRSVGFDAQTFQRPTLLLKFPMPKNNACLLLGVHMLVGLRRGLARKGRNPKALVASSA
jgi:FixJ family two-component response regulator